jgi:hypothetical protein
MSSLTTHATAVFPYRGYGLLCHARLRYCCIWYTYQLLQNHVHTLLLSSRSPPTNTYYLVSWYSSLKIIFLDRLKWVLNISSMWLALVVLDARSVFISTASIIGICLHKFATPTPTTPPQKHHQVGPLPPVHLLDQSHPPRLRHLNTPKCLSNSNYTNISLEQLRVDVKPHSLCGSFKLVTNTTIISTYHPPTSGAHTQ